MRLWMCALALAASGCVEVAVGHRLREGEFRSGDRGKHIFELVGKAERDEIRNPALRQ
mgnify:CR=1 FL=1